MSTQVNSFTFSDWVFIDYGKSREKPTRVRTKDQDQRQQTVDETRSKTCDILGQSHVLDMETE